MLSTEIRTSGDVELNGEGWRVDIEAQLGILTEQETQVRELYYKGCFYFRPQPLAVRAGMSNRNSLVKLSSFYS